MNNHLSSRPSSSTCVVEGENGPFQIEWDAPIEMADGIVLRADIFRPVGDGQYPVLLSYGPYGKGLAFQDGYPSAWDIMLKEHPDAAAGSGNKFQNWEVADPEKWIHHGYICIRVDSRGAGRSPGVLDVHSEREIDDLVACIEWAAVQPWSNGKVGLAGISYYATNQWRAAAKRPPHLAAICVWEGYNDRYRESARHGGILCSFTKNWQQMQVLSVQHGLGANGPRSAFTGELVCGPETLTPQELAANRRDISSQLSEHRLDDDFYKARTPVLEDIQIPLLSAANWGGHGLHTRGNFEGYLRAGSRQKWLEVHGGAHWAGFYTDYGVELQRRFFDHFLKGEDNGWQDQPPIQLQIRHPNGTFTQRYEEAWPIPRTRWTRFYLDPVTMALSPTPPALSGVVTYEAMGRGLTFLSAPFESETEITGPSAATLRCSSTTSDADLFLVLRLFAPDGSEVVMRGAIDPHAPIAQGWLRASHRRTDPERSMPWRPYHLHDREEALTPGVPVDVEVEIWPTSIIVPKGYRIGLSIRGRDYEYEGPAASLSNMKNPMRGCGPFIHDDPQDRPTEIFAGHVSIHVEAGNPAFLTLPVVPPV
ncbi:CocE/NonD family hydrolase [Aquabacter sp. P-9]|uniref:CocE/NonD family hydrolase n=1 Tax=Aquabacter sediminis TaxID=3029197 RepID=UPI00237DA314|nr:CocE/NonD family hydrolase [Aquabacter sp. P-9]MDE1571152.1 CocE/NonD family hydrolase [Aquabacter sp. P-9]